MDVAITYCYRCKKNIDVVIGDDNKMFVCPKCKVWVANRQYKLNKRTEDKMTESKSDTKKAKVANVDIVKIEELAGEGKTRQEIYAALGDTVPKSTVRRILRKLKK